MHHFPGAELHATAAAYGEERAKAPERKSKRERDEKKEGRDGYEHYREFKAREILHGAKIIDGGGGFLRCE
ncbi:hypothetical protein E2C01_005073 [Portunus trituberculatus]|uniref:Uncharacterized protein n=1 Tax=Portunus trituberculatus TaxID=210409 RepID=A0A5B7CY52_PORTR|nr:hypothetical protein [Portunus trituberculatus]